MRTPIVLAKFSVRVIKAGRADPRAQKTNRSANDITASNAADSSVSMISSVEFLTRGGGKQRADNRPASKMIILEQGPERIAVNQKMARRKATYLSLDQTFDLTQSENWPICY
jgi:hypothetical protein